MDELSNAISEALRIVTLREPTPTVAELARTALPGLTSSFGESVGTIARQIELLPTLAATQADAVLANTQALTQNTVAQRGDGAALAGNVASTALKVLGGGLGLVPLVSSIVGLFRGSNAEHTPSLTPYIPPSTVNFVGAIPQQPSQPVQAVDYGQDGMPRTVPGSAQVWAPSVTVQVNAMNSRSFLDHSDDIAQAVRKALLDAHTLGDVVSEL